MGRFLFILVLLVGAICGILLVLPSVLPTDTYRGRVETAATEALGRPVSLKGDVNLTLVPKIQIRAQDVAIANADGFGDQPLAEMKELRLTLALWPLIQRQVNIEEFVLVEPTIRLEQRATANNWTFKDAPAQQTTQEGHFLRQPGALPLEASFGDVRIENASVSYVSPGQSVDIRALNLTSDLPSIDAPARLTGDLVLNDEPFNFDTQINSLRTLFEGGATPVTLALESPVAQLNFDGSFLESQTFDFAGDFDVNLPDLPRLARLAGANLPQGRTYRRFQAQGHVRGEPGTLSLQGTGEGDNPESARIVFDDITALGLMNLAYDRARPFISGTMTIATLDVTPYAGGGASSAPANTSGPMEFSQSPMDLSALGLVDANLKLNVGRLKFQNLEVSDVALNTVLDRARLQANLQRFSLYQGQGSAVAVANARTATPSYSLNARLNGLVAEPFLMAAADFDRLQGLGNINLDLTSNGASPHAIINALDGTTEFSFSDGAIKGLNLARIIRGIRQAITTQQLPEGFGENQQTDFSTLTVRSTLNNGRANTQLNMLSPLVRVNGDGVFNLAAQNMDYRLTPRAVASLEGQGGSSDLVGIPIPIRLRGSFTEPQIGLDYEAIGRSLVRAQLNRAVGGDNANPDRSLEDVARDALTDALLGNSRNRNDESENTDSEEEEEDPAQQLLRSLLGGG